jgi:hypothetical protein
VFKNEIATVDHIAGLTNDLHIATDFLWDDTEDIAQALRDLDFEELTDDETDSIFDSMVDAERWAARHLKEFDTVLRKIIAARRKLGDFPITSE